MKNRSLRITYLLFTILSLSFYISSISSGNVFLLLKELYYCGVILPTNSPLKIRSVNIKSDDIKISSYAGDMTVTEDKQCNG